RPGPVGGAAPAAAARRGARFVSAPAPAGALAGKPKADRHTLTARCQPQKEKQTCPRRKGAWPTVPGSRTAELRHASDARHAGAARLGTAIPASTRAPLFPTWSVGLDPGAARLSLDLESDLDDLATWLPARRADAERRPLLGARSRRFEGPTWGTH